MRSMVEGAHLRADCNDVAENAVHVLEDVTSGNAQYTKAFTSEQRIARCIPPRLVTEAVSLTVHFDDQAAFETGEVDGQLTNGKLLSELMTARWPPKLLPQQHLRQAHLAP